MASKCYVGAMNFEPVELPAGYTQVESVKLTGTQWFDTGFKPNQNTRVVMECKADVLTSGGVFPFGVRTSTNAAAFAVAVTTTQVFANFNATYQFADYKNTYERMVIDFNKNVVTFKGSEEVAITLTNGNFTATSNLLIGNMNQAGTALDSSFTWQGDICPCKVYDNGTLVRDYVPCITSEGIAGLFDRVNNTFCGNAGTGTVIAGSVLKSVAKPVTKMYVGIGGVAKKVKKAYIGVKGIAQLCFTGSVNVSKLAVTYTGNHTDQIVTMGDGKEYRLLTLTSTGTLTLDSPVSAEVWFCNGGGNGANATSSGGGKGGNGGNVRRKKTISTKTAVITIGAGGSGATSVKTDSETISAETFRTPQGGGGGTGGSSGNGANGSGAAYSIIPFEDSYFTSKPCAGGGGGAAYKTSAGGASEGGGGASNTTAGTSPTTSNTGGSGGATGGGTGGKSNSSEYVHASSASYYGSGGGGGGLRGQAGSGGSGYQGICYIRIPLDQPA